MSRTIAERRREQESVAVYLRLQHMELEGEMRKRKYYLRVVPVVLALGAVCCRAATPAPQNPVQNRNPETQVSVGKLLEEFKTAKYFWMQLDVGQKLVQLGD